MTSLSVMKEVGVSAIQLKDAGFTASELKALRLKDTGFTASELKGARFTAPELTDAGFTANELKDVGLALKPRCCRGPWSCVCDWGF
jgi:intracellular multiplication protein IcmE